MVLQLDRQLASNSLRQWWSVISGLLLAVVLVEAFFAGAMLSGFAWAHPAHSVNAVLLIASASIAGLVAIVTLWRVPNGRKLGMMLLSLAVLVILQAVVGALSAKGANLLWLHVPLGVALFGLARQGVAVARTLDRGQ
jgi:hypothetical protein